MKRQLTIFKQAIKFVIVAVLTIFLLVLTSLSAPVLAQTVIAMVPIISSPFGVAVNSVTNRIYVTNYAYNGVSVVDGTSNSVVATVPINDSVSGIAVNPATNLIYVADEFNIIWIIDGTSNLVIGNIEVGSINQLRLRYLAVNSASNRIYALDRLNWRVFVIDGTTNTILATIQLGAFPDGIAINPSTNRIYVANINNSSVSVIDGSNNTVIATVPVSGAPSSVTLNPLTNLIYVTSNTTGIVEVISGVTNSVVTSIPTAGGGQLTAGVNPTTNRIYVTASAGSPTASTLTIIDGTTNAIVAIIPVGVDAGGSGPGSIGVNSITNRIYIANFQSNMITVVQDPVNQPPTASAGGPYSVPEGGSTTLTGSGSDPDGDPITFAWDLDNNGTFETAGQNVTFSAAGRDGPSSQPVVLQVCDNKGACATSDATVNITNVAPTVGAITAPVDPVQVNTAVNTSASFTDPGVLDTHTAVWNWGDGTTSLGTVTETNGSGTVAGTHTYTAAGVYTLILTVTDKDGASGQSIFQYVVIFDSTAGFVTGAGMINSPTGAFPQDPTLTGRANFSFSVKYLPGDIAPNGGSQFKFRLAGINFASTSYQWLVISGTKATFKGVGTNNGSGNYTFLVSTIDGSPDKYRIKITDNATNTVFYDNEMGSPETADPTTTLLNGSIVIH